MYNPSSHPTNINLSDSFILLHKKGGFRRWCCRGKYSIKLRNIRSLFRPLCIGSENRLVVATLWSWSSQVCQEISWLGLGKRHVLVYIQVWTDRGSKSPEDGSIIKLNGARIARSAIQSWTSKRKHLHLQTSLQVTSQAQHSMVLTFKLIFSFCTSLWTSVSSKIRWNISPFTVWFTDHKKSVEVWLTALCQRCQD